MNENDQARITGITHRYVRWMMILLPLLLLVVSVLTGLKKGEFETSISAYYGGPVRDILVGTLVIDMADAQKKQVVWRGMGVKEVDTQAKPDKRDKSIANAVKKIFKDFPPKAKT